MLTSLLKVSQTSGPGEPGRCAACAQLPFYSLRARGRASGAPPSPHTGRAQSLGLRARPGRPQKQGVPHTSSKGLSVLTSLQEGRQDDWSLRAGAVCCGVSLQGTCLRRWWRMAAGVGEEVVFKQFKAETSPGGHCPHPRAPSQPRWTTPTSPRLCWRPVDNPRGLLLQRVSRPGRGSASRGAEALPTLSRMSPLWKAAPFQPAPRCRADMLLRVNGSPVPLVLQGDGRSTLILTLCCAAAGRRASVLAGACAAGGPGGQAWSTCTGAASARDMYARDIMTTPEGFPVLCGFRSVPLLFSMPALASPGLKMTPLMDLRGALTLPMRLLIL